MIKRAVLAIIYQQKPMIMKMTGTRLPTHSTTGIDSSMVKETHHNELCQWLKAVATKRT